MRPTKPGYYWYKGYIGGTLEETLTKWTPVEVGKEGDIYLFASDYSGVMVSETAESAWGPEIVWKKPKRGTFGTAQGMKFVDSGSS